jgi:predicted amidohydrolase
MNESPSFYALALQTTCTAVNAAADPRACMLESCARVHRQAEAAKRFIGGDLRLIVLPEYLLTGFPMGESAAQWAEKAAIAAGGPEYAALGELAVKVGVFLAGNAYERDDHFPGIHFQTSFIIDPRGEVILRYRRLVSLFAPSPYDVLDRYLELYGEAALFPVVDSDIGRLAAIASEEILYPEIARALALRGAEIFVHSSSEAASALPTPKNIAKQARALENLAYVVSANTAGIEGIGIPRASTDGNSQVVDFRGSVIAQAQVGESIAACSEIDLAALRRFRRRPGMANTLSRQPLALWRRALGSAQIQPANTLIAGDGSLVAPTAAFYGERQRRAIDRLIEDDIIV